MVIRIECFIKLSVSHLDDLVPKWKHIEFSDCSFATEIIFIKSLMLNDIRGNYVPYTIR